MAVMTVRDRAGLDRSSSSGGLTQSVEMDGAEIRFGVSGSGERTLLLVHGHQANAAWWHAVAPRLEQRWRVVRLDLSGHGDSGHRAGGYGDGAVWLEEVHAVLAASGTHEAVLVGHSMGGRIALASAVARPQGVLGVIALDSVLRAVPVSARAGWHPERRPRVRATLAEALGRFRLAPAQPDPAEEVLAVVAEGSIRSEADGWTWKYDQRGLPGVGARHVEDRLGELSVPVRFVHAELSPLVGEDAVDLLRARVPAQQVETVEMAGVHHHLILDAPQRCARLIDELATGLRG